MSIVVFDRLGDLNDDLITRCMALGVPADQLHIIDPVDPEWVIPFNPFLIDAEPHVVADSFVDAVRRHSASWGVEIDHNMRHIVQALVRARQSPLEIDLVFSSEAFRQSIVQQQPDSFSTAFFERFERASRDQRNQWHMAIANKLNPLLFNPQLRRILSGTSAINFRQILSSRNRILLVYLRRDRMQGAGDLLGDLLMQAVWNAIQSLGKARPNHHTTLILDEFQHYAHGCVTEIATFGRHFGLRLIAAHQSQAQIDPDTRALLRNNAALRVIFNVGPIDAREMAQELYHWQRNEAVAELLSLKTGEAYVAKRGQHPTRVWTPDISREPPPEIIEASRTYREQSMARNARQIALVDREIEERHKLHVSADSSRNPNQKEVRHVRLPRTS